MEISMHDFIIPRLKVMEIRRMLLKLNPDMEIPSNSDIINMALILFELMCDAHYDKENERKKVILKAFVEHDEDLFLDGMERLLKQEKEFIDSIDENFDEIKDEGDYL